MADLHRNTRKKQVRQFRASPVMSCQDWALESQQPSLKWSWPLLSTLWLLFLAAGLFVAPLLAQSTSWPRTAAPDAYRNPQIQAALVLIRDRLPQLAESDREQAVAEFLSLRPELRKLDAADSEFLEGQFYASLADVQTAIPHFRNLVADPVLGYEAQHMLCLLLYYQAVDYLQTKDPQSAQDWLREVVDTYPLGRYYPTFLYLLLDSLAESGRTAIVKQYLDRYTAFRDWYQDSFRPRRESIIADLEQLNLTPYFTNPTPAQYQVLEASLDSIRDRLDGLYEEYRDRALYYEPATLDSLAITERKILEEFKARLSQYSYMPALNVRLESESGQTEPPLTELELQSIQLYRTEEARLQAAKDSADKIQTKLNQIDELLEQRFQLYEQDDLSVLGRNFSDMELKRLIDIEKNIGVYKDVLEAIDELESHPRYSTLNLELSAQRQEYVLKLADLQNRKERYLAFRKHMEKAEEDIFIQAWEDYYALSQFKQMFDEELPETEEEMRTVITRQYFRSKQKVISQQRENVIRSTKDSPILQNSLSELITNLDFMNLHLDYRALWEREQRRANNQELAEEESRRQLQEIITAKALLLKRYQEFVAQNPDFRALAQPEGGFLLNNAINFYHMGELQYDMDLEGKAQEQALDYYRNVLEIQPDFYLRDYVLYNIAYLSSERARQDVIDRYAQALAKNPRQQRDRKIYGYKISDFIEALEAYQEIAQNAASPLRDESLYRLGVLYFIIGIDADEPIRWYQEARTRFQPLIADPASAYRYEARYQRGWLNMNQSDEPSLLEAIDDFLFLIQAVDAGRITNAALAADYRGSSIENLAFSLAALDGSENTNKAKGIPIFQEKLADHPDREMLARILERTAYNKAELYAPLQAVDYLELRLQLKPTDLHNPALVDSMIRLYHTTGIPLREGQDLKAITAAKYAYILEYYNRNSPWYQQNIAGKEMSVPDIQNQLKVIRSAFEYTRITLYNQMIETAADADIKAYHDLMEQYVAHRELFGDKYLQWLSVNDEFETRTQAALAAKLDTNKALFQATQGMWKYNDKYPDNADYYNYEGLAYEYTKRVYASLDSLLLAGQTPESGLPPTRDSLYAFYRDASLRFINVLNQRRFASEDNRLLAIQVTLDLSNIQIKQGLLNEARASFNEFLKYEEQHSRSTNRTVYLSLADIAQKENKLQEAEAAYRSAVKYASNDKDRDDITQQMRAQIQKGIDQAEQRGDYELAAGEYIRLSNEFISPKTLKDKAKLAQNKALYIGNRTKAAQAYILAGKYQQAIDVKLALVESAENLQEKYSLYVDSWTIADTLMRDPAKVEELKTEFMTLEPASNYSYLLKLERISKLQQNPATRDQAVAELLALHDLIKARKIDSGGHSADAIYLDAIEIYREAGATDKLTQLIDDFIKAYPKHPRVPGFLLYLANNYRETQDQEKYEYYARELFIKDRTQAGPYQSIAGGKLAAIFAQFDAAYKIRDWKTAFQKRDDFKKLEAVYKKDNLQLDTAVAYNDFAIAEAEYNELQAKTAYLAEFERQLRVTEQSELLRISPAEAIFLTNKTTWEGHLFGGLSRIPKLSQRTKAEYEKITNLLKRPQNKYLTTAQRMRALDLVCRLNDHTADIIDIRIARYLETAREVVEYKTLYNPDRYASMVAGIAKQAADYTYKNHRSVSHGIYREIYTNLVLAGYSDIYTQRAIQQLQASQILPEYHLAPYPLDQDWVLSLRRSGPVGRDPSRFAASTSETGYRLGSFQIPAGDTLTIQRQFDPKLIPEYSYLHFAFGNNPEAFINNVKVDLEYVQVDSVAGRDGFTQHYAARISGKPWKEGGNILRVEFANLSGQAEQLHFGVELIYDAEKFRQSLPTQTIRIASSPDWKAYRIDPETGAEIPVPTVPATAFTLPLKTSLDWESYRAQAIWIPETESDPAAQVAFVLDFALQEDFRDVQLEYVAPETSALYLNGQAILENYFYDYDTVPFQAYTKQLTLPREFLRQGHNQLRIVSQNTSFFRGMQAALTITQTARE